MGIQFVGDEGLLHVVVHAHLVTVPHVFGRGEGRGEQDGCLGVGLADAAHHLEAVHHGHVDVADDDVGLEGGPHLQALFAVGGCLYVVAADDVYQSALHHVAQVGVVFYQE